MDIITQHRPCAQPDAIRIASMAEPDNGLPPEIKAGAPGVRQLITRGDRPCSVCRKWPNKGQRMWATCWRGRVDAVCNICANNIIVAAFVVLALVAAGGAA